ncbi:AraC family transcriptional regulator, partial [Butyrivibrio sp.]|nr:AraC family transcriptional regulator [Butyrivibrio sp.]
FSDVHNFSRAFKKSTGLTPSAYRNTYAKRLLYHV